MSAWGIIISFVGLFFATILVGTPFALVFLKGRLIRRVEAAKAAVAVLIMAQAKKEVENSDGKGTK